MSRKYDNGGFKWLRVKNWEKYQPSGKLFKKDARLPWVRDWTDKLDNYEFTRLTYFQRSLYEQVCLAIGTRPLRTVPNDPTWIARETHAVASDVPHIGHALATLVSRGFFIPIETEKFSDDEVESSRGDRDRDGEDEIEKECEMDSNNNNDVVVVGKVIAPPTKYSEEQVRAHIAKFPEGTWVWSNATEDALKRPGFIEHVMSLEPPKRRAAAATPDGKGFED